MRSTLFPFVLLSTLVGCSGTPENPPALTFISAVSQKLSLDKELQFRLNRSSPFMAPIYVVGPPLRGGAADLDAWQLSCEVSSGKSGQAKVWLTEGKEPEVNLTPDRIKWGKAFVVAAERLILEDRLRFPFRLRSRKTSIGWSFYFIQIPDVVGSDTSVRVSSDLKVVQVLEGH